MKTIFTRLLLLSLFIGLVSCETKTYQPEEILGDKFIDPELNLYLKYDCMDPRYQPVHLDIKHGFGLLAKLDVTDDKISKIQFYFKEADGLSRYDLVDAVFDKTSEVNGVIIHEFTVEINKGNKAETEVKMRNLQSGFMMKKGEEMDIHIKSDDLAIASKKYRPDQGFTNFGQQFCKTIVINP